MSANVSISLHENVPEARIITCADGRRFISFDISPAVCIYTNTFDGQAIAAARRIAACMTTVADDLERSLLADQPAPVESAAVELSQFEEEVSL